MVEVKSTEEATKPATTAATLSSTGVRAQPLTRRPAILALWAS